VLGQGQVAAGTAHTKLLVAAAEQHSSALLTFLVNAEGLSLTWIPICDGLLRQACRLACGDADLMAGVGSHRPASSHSLIAGRIMRHVKIKRVPGGAPSESFVVRGVVFSNQLAHKGMRSRICDPRVLLLGCAVEYERGSRFVSLATHAATEKDYLPIAADRILHERPDVVLLEKSMARQAQGLLRRAGISVALNVKRQVLERIASLTGAPIVQSVELLGGGGQCVAVWGGIFRALPLSSRARPLLCLDAPVLGTAYSSIILRGPANAQADSPNCGPAQPLVRIKAVLLHMLYAQACLFGEAAFLSDLGAAVSDTYRIESTGEKLIESPKAAAHCTGVEGVGNLSGDHASAAHKQETGRDAGQREDLGVGDEGEEHNQGEEEDGGAFGLIGISPHVLCPLPAKVEEQLQECAERQRLSQWVTDLTRAPDIADDAKEGSEMLDESPGVLSQLSMPLPPPSTGEGAFKVRESSLRDWRKPGHKLSKLSAAEVVRLAAGPRGNRIWATPGGGADEMSGDTLRVLFSSTCGSSVCVQGSEMSLGNSPEEHLTLHQFLDTLCFDPMWRCPARGCAASMLDHEHFFVHGEGRIRLRVSRRAGGGEAVGAHKRISVRTRCVSCARTTNAGQVLSVAGSRLPLARFLLLLLYERQLLSQDETCGHPLHTQLIMFSLSNLTALFIHEPIALCHVVVPPTHIQALSSAQKARLLLAEIAEADAAAERLQLCCAPNNEDPPSGSAATPQQLDQVQAVRVSLAAMRKNLASIKAEELQTQVHALLQVASAIFEDATGVGVTRGETDDAQHYDAPAPSVPLEAEANASSVAPLLDECSSAPTPARGEAQSAGVDADERAPGSLAQETDLQASNTVAQAAPNGEDKHESCSAGRPRSHLPHAPLPKPATARPNVLDGTLLSDAAGRSCHLLPGSVMLSGTPLALHEDEPASIIAFALSSRAYATALHDDPPLDGASAGGGAPPRKHVRLELDLSTPSFKVDIACKVYHAAEFDTLRSRYCAGGGVGPEELIGSLRRCKKWNATGGRSTAAFLKSADERFVLKEISRREQGHFLQAAMAYFEFVHATMDQKIPSCLAKILGMFKLTSRRTKHGLSQTQASKTKWTTQVLLVMENLFFQEAHEILPTLRVFDLKGSSRNRFVKEAKRGEVQMDDNFHAYIQHSPFYLSEEAKRLLTVSIFNDTVFLTKVNVMDYSLLLGIDEENSRIVVGIIDYVRQYTMDKQAETYYKMAIDRVAMKSGQADPTVIAPPEYRTRFREAMARNFVAAPAFLALERAEGEQQPVLQRAPPAAFGPDHGVRDITALLGSPLAGGSPQSPRRDSDSSPALARDLSSHSLRSADHSFHAGNHIPADSPVHNLFA